MKAMRLFLLCIFISVQISFIFAQEYWHQFISNNDVNAMAWDSVYNDVLWIGTNGGLIRYNVETGGIVLYNTINSELPSNDITTLAFDSNNDLWIGTANNGLAKYDGNTFITYNTGNSDLAGNRIKKIQFDETEVLWVLYDNIGPIPFNNDNQSTSSNREQSVRFDMDVIASNDIWVLGYFHTNFIAHFDGTQWTSHSYIAFTIKKDQDGYVWITQYTRVCKFIDISSDWIYYTDIPVSFLDSIYIDENNIKWFGSSQGLVKFDEEEWELYNVDNSQLPSNKILSMIEDRNNTGMWIGTNKGLAFFDGSEFEVHDINVSGLLSNNIKDAIVAQDGVIWFATDKGICKYDGYAFNELTTLNSPLTSDIINALAIDANDKIWIGTNGGLFSFDNDSWQHFNSDNSFLNYDFVQLLTIDANNNMYIFTALPYGYIVDPYRKDKNKNDLDQRSFVLVDLDDMEIIAELYHTYYGYEELFLVTTIEVDQDNNAWYNGRVIYFVGGYDSYEEYLYKYDGIDVHYIDSISTVFLNLGMIISSIYPYNEGIWIATSRPVWTGEYDMYSLFFFENGEITDYYSIMDSLLPHYNVTSLLIDGDTFWIGTQGGLCRVVNNNWEVFTIEDSLLPSNRIRRIFLDNDSRVWIVTDKGLVVYGEKLFASDENEALKPTLTLYSAYPNPFYPNKSNRSLDSINIRYEVSRSTHLKIDVFNIKGQHIITLKNEQVQEGSHITYWDGKDKNGLRVSSGLYFFRVMSDKDEMSGKILILN